MLSINDHILITENKNDFNLQKIFDYVDKRGFNNLFKDSGEKIKVSWTGRLKGTFAVAKAKITKPYNVLVEDSMSVLVNSKYAWTENILVGIMAHEMVHLYFYITGDFAESHGAKFLAKRSEVSKLLGIDVPISEEMPDLDQIDIEYKELYMVVSNKNNVLLVNKNKVGTDQVSWFNDLIAKSQIKFHGLVSTMLGEYLTIRRGVEKGRGLKFQNIGKKVLVDDELRRLGII